MLYEDDVTDAVCAKLEKLDYRIEQRLRSTQRGDDIIAVKKGQSAVRLYIESKGETSSVEGSGNYGNPFNSSQVLDHVAKALYKAVAVLSREVDGKHVHAGIALPSNMRHHDVINPIAPVLDRLGIAMFWVEQNHEVEVVSMWKL